MNAQWKSWQWDHALGHSVMRDARDADWQEGTVVLVDVDRPEAGGERFHILLGSWGDYDGNSGLDVTREDAALIREAIQMGHSP